MPTPGRAATLLLVPLVAVAPGCGDDGGDGASGAGGAVQVVATTSIWGDLVAEVAGDCATVDVLVPRGGDTHDFEPSARQAAGLRDADLIVANGLGLEERLVDTLDAAADDGVPLLELAPELDPLPFGDHGAAADHDDDRADEDGADDHGDDDPHVWQDPLRVAAAVPRIGDALVAAGCDAPQVSDRVDAAVDELEVLDADLAAAYDTIPVERRVLVTNHDAFGYLADRYDLRIVGSVVPGGSTLAEPSSADLADLAATIEDEGVPAVFAETTRPTDLADALAAEVDRPVAVVELYSESLGEPGSGADTYPGLMRTNAERITGALG